MVSPAHDGGGKETAQYCPQLPRDRLLVPGTAYVQLFWGWRMLLHPVAEAAPVCVTAAGPGISGMPQHWAEGLRGHLKLSKSGSQKPIESPQGRAQ